MRALCYAQTNIGSGRDNNEDNYYCNGTFKRDPAIPVAEAAAEQESRRLIYGVFDGMGGEANGEQAALLCAQTLHQCSSDEPFDALDFFRRANVAVCDMIAASGQIGGSTPALLDGVKVLHMSGITPVLSESCLAMTKAAFALAKEKGVAISFDPNIRRKLWRGQDYAPLIRELTLQSEIVLLGLDEADALFGLRDPDAIFDLLFRDGCAQYVAIKDGGNGAWVADKTTREKLPPYPCKPIEPIGAGDGFNAGFLAGILQGRDVVTAGRMGAICGALATQTPGDVEGYPDAAQMEAALTGAAITYR